MLLSIVVPLFNEAESLGELHRQIVAACEGSSIPFELVLVDDGSTDGGWDIVRRLSETDPRVRGVRFRRNFGKSAALTAGLARTRGDLILTMDADLQDDPAEIPGLLKTLDSGYDFVNGWKLRRLDPWHKVYPSKVFNSLVGRLTGLHLHDHNCGLKLGRAEVWKEVRLYGERHRFIPVLAHSRGFRVTEMPVNHRPREFGHSKFGARRFVRGLLDLFTVVFLTAFGQRPQHLLGGLGLLSAGLGSLGMFWLAILWVFRNVIGVAGILPIGGRPLLLYSAVLLLMGVQMTCMGLLAELIVANTSGDDQSFSVAEELG